MKLTAAARALGGDDRTLKLWIERAELAPFFSETARREGMGRDLNDDDLIVANTIRTLRAGKGNSNVDWSAIAESLAGGHRDRDLPQSAQIVPSGMSIADQERRMAVVTEQRDRALMDANDWRVETERLRSEIADLHERHQTYVDGLQRDHHGEAERLLREQRELAEKLARTEVELKLWREGKLRPSR